MTGRRDDAGERRNRGLCQARVRERLVLPQKGVFQGPLGVFIWGVSSLWGSSIGLLFSAQEADRSGDGAEVVAATWGDRLACRSGISGLVAIGPPSVVR